MWDNVKAKTLCMTINYVYNLQIIKQMGYIYKMILSKLCLGFGPVEKVICRDLCVASGRFPER